MKTAALEEDSCDQSLTCTQS